MDVDRCLALLELDDCSSVEEARRAYLDLVRVWHPDRFSGDPRLRDRAEEKVKQLNLAYETLVRHLEHSDGERIRSTPETDPRSRNAGSATEAFFEAGTRTMLTIWHSLHRTFQQAVNEARGQETKEKRRENDR